MNRVFLTMLLCIISFLTVHAQECYIRLDDASGFNTDLYQTELELAACKLIQTLPEAYRDSFKVFDFGFYLHQDRFSGGFPQVFQQVIDQVSLISPYYVLFGKQTDQNGMYTNFWVDVALPFDESCVDNVQNDILTNKIKWVTEDEYSKYNREPSAFHFAEIAGLKELEQRIAMLTNCCDTNPPCHSCPSDEDIRRLLEEKGFVSANIDSFYIELPQAFTIQPKRNAFIEKNDLLIDGNSIITVWTNGDVIWRLNEGLEDELNGYTSTSKKGIIASNQDMCNTNLYSLIYNDHYANFELAIVEFLWYKTDSITGEIVDKKLYFKEYYSLTSQTAEEEYSTIEDGRLRCHPKNSIYSFACEDFPLPTDYLDYENGDYTISLSVDDNGGYSYYGFIFDDIYLWQRGDIVDYDDPIEYPTMQRDERSRDCDTYPFSEYSNYARRKSFYSTEELIKEFERWTNKNILVAYKDEMKKIIHHYYYGNGETLEWNCDERFSQYIYTQPAIQDAIMGIQELTHDWLTNDENLDGFFESNLVENLEVILPDEVPSGTAFKPLYATAVIAIGGIQGWEFSVINFKTISCSSGRCYEVEFLFTLIDIFGAGTDDRNRGGPWYSQIPKIGDGRIPGLTQMWLLQHCRNYDCQPIGGRMPCFIPFEHRINFGHKFRICID